MSKVVAVARVRVTVEVTRGSWGDDCKLEQVFDQAGREAAADIQNLIAKAGARVVGEPVVEAVLARKES
jgi:hypothetical protein